jgi:hypothetical protein
VEKWQSLLWAIYSHELKLKELYESFARHFPSESAFWSQLAREEHGHAELLIRLRDHIQAGMLEVRDSSLKEEAIKNAIAHIDTLIKKCAEGQIDLMGALSRALDLEQGLSERGLLQCLSYPLENQQSVGTLLQEQTQKHVQIIRTKLNAANKLSRRH